MSVRTLDVKYLQSVPTPEASPTKASNCLRIPFSHIPAPL